MSRPIDNEKFALLAQRDLKARGHYQGEIDGWAGPKTRDAYAAALPPIPAAPSAVDSARPELRIGPDHWLEGATRDPLPGRGAMPVPRFLVEHFTGGWADGVSVMRERGVSAHFLVQRDGKIIQCVPCNQIAHHAGESKWRDPNTGKIYSGLNSCSIGIEIANCGDLERDLYPSTMGKPLAGTPIPRLKAKHKIGGPIRSWEVFPPAQLAAVEALSAALVRRYNLGDVIGHDDISPGRKVDPGPSFDMLGVREFCGFTAPVPRIT